MSDALNFIAVIVNPEWMPEWAVIEVPGSRGFLGTGKSTRVTGTIDNLPIPVALMPTGRGDHFISVSKALRAQLGKSVGDSVVVRIER